VSHPEFASLAKYVFTGLEMTEKNTEAMRLQFNRLFDKEECWRHYAGLRFLDLRPIDESTGLSRSFYFGKKVSMKEGYMYKQLAGMDGAVQFFCRRSLCLFLTVVMSGLVLALGWGCIWVIDVYLLNEDEDNVRADESAAEPYLWLILAATAVSMIYFFVCRCSQAKLPLAEERRRWFVLMPDYLAYYRSFNDKEPAGVLLFEQGMHVHLESLTWRSFKDTVSVESNSRIMRFRAYHGHVAGAELWCDAILQEVGHKSGAQECLESPRGGDMETGHRVPRRSSIRGGELPRFRSFAPPRRGCKGYWFADGEQAFKAMYEAINSATTQVLITDWILSPECQLIRPKGVDPASTEAAQYEVGAVLKAAAVRGVEVRIMLFRELELALPNNSAGL